MNRPIAICALVWVISLCGITYAQDRGAASSIVWSPDGHTIAVASTTGLWLFDNNFNEMGSVEIELDTVSGARFVAWNFTSEYLSYSGMHHDPVSIVDIGELTVIREIYELYPWSPIRWHPSANRIVSGTLNGDTRILDAITGEEVFYFDSVALYPNDGLYHETLGLCWFNEVTLIIVSLQRIFIVDVDEETIMKEFGPAALFSAHVECNPENQILSVDGQLFDLQSAAHTWDFVQGREFEYPEPLPKPAAVKWSPDSRHIVANLTGCLTRVYDGRTGKVVAGMPGGLRNLGTAPYFFIDSIAWHPDGSRFAVVGQFGDIRVWDANTYQLLQRFDGFELHPTLLAHLEKSDQPGRERCP